MIALAEKVPVALRLGLTPKLDNGEWWYVWTSPRDVATISGCGPTRREAAAAFECAFSAWREDVNGSER